MDPITKDIPIIAITADQVSPLGITLGNQPTADAGTPICQPVLRHAGPRPDGRQRHSTRSPKAAV
jgi:hypothetical protein